MHDELNIRYYLVNIAIFFLHQYLHVCAHQGEGVLHDLHCLDVPELGEVVLQMLLLRLPGQPAHKQLHWKQGHILY